MNIIKLSFFGLLLSQTSPLMAQDEALHEKEIKAELDKAKRVPHFEDGKIKGVRAVRNGEVGAYDQLELREGDIIQEVNEVPVDSPEAALKELDN